MWSRVIQEWTQIGGSTTAKVTQAEPFWVETSAVQDAAFLVEVSFTQNTRIYLTFETAPVSEEAFFLPMQKDDALDLASVSGSLIQPCYAHATLGPPVASFVRWRVTPVLTPWAACFRITMLGV